MYVNSFVVHTKKFIPGHTRVHFLGGIGTNIFLSAALDEKSKSKIVSITQGCDIYAPEILPYEIGNAI